MHKRLTNISDVRLQSVCVQTVDGCIRTKRKRKFNENQENNKALGECKQLSQEKSQTLVRYVGQQTDSKRLSDVLAHKRLHGQIYIRLLPEHRTSVCCPFAVQNFLLCRNSGRSQMRTVYKIVAQRDNGRTSLIRCTRQSRYTLRDKGTHRSRLKSLKKTKGARKKRKLYF